MPAAISLRNCRVANIDSEVKCATLEVFENRETNSGRKIALNIVVLPAGSRIKEPDPIFLFAGGPGQAAADLAREAMAILGGLNAKRDIVLIDQRGTGKSNGLNCKPGDVEAMETIDTVKRDQLSRKQLLECRDTLAKRADLTRYTTTIAMADIDAARGALGAEKINLWGGSYGTRAALEYLRLYPNHVRSVILDGVAPSTMAMPATFARDAGAAYEKVLAACAGESACARRFPQLRSDIDELFVTLRRSPRMVRLPDALAGVPRDVAITKERVLMAVFSSLYVAEFAALLPTALKRAQKGDFAPLMSLSSAFGAFEEEKMFAGMRLSVVCAEDVPRMDRKQSSNNAPFDDLFVSEFVKACDEWPHGTVSADFLQPPRSDKPVLILSGGLDPVTPPVFGEEVKKTLTNSLHLIAKNVGHGVSSRGCAPRLIKKFIESGSVAELDGSCLDRLPRPMFYEPMREKIPADAGSKARTGGAVK
jgi:pimeloyl-ACP methyl ester carboxylesterase